MTVAEVAWDAVSFGRLNAAEGTTDWSATGSGASPTIETDYFYQGAACISIQVKTSVYTLTYTSASTDMNTVPRAILYKFIQTNKNAIDGSGLRLRIGSSNTAYASYDIFTAATYPKPGGFVVLAIQPSVVQWQTSNTGGPDFTAVTTWVIESDASATAKAPNLGLDAIDVMDAGTGLTLTRGGEGDADSVFQDFVAADEETVGNSWGIVQSREGILYVTGVLTIANSTTNTTFTDSNKTLVFPDHRVTNGFCGLDFNLEDADTTIDISACAFNGVGALYTADDTRPDYTATGTACPLTIAACTFDGFRAMVFTSNCTIETTSFLNGLSITQASANIDSCTVLTPTNLVDTGFFISDDPEQLNNLTITIGAGGGHAIEITATGTYSLTGHTYNGYNTSNATSNSTIFNDSGGAVTLNITDGDTPTIRNGAGASTTVTAAVTVNITGMKDNTEVRVFDQGTTDVVDGIENATTGGTDDRSFSFSTTASKALDIRLINTTHVYLLIQYTTTGASNQPLPVVQQFDRNYENN